MSAQAAAVPVAVTQPEVAQAIGGGPQSTDSAMKENESKNPTQVQAVLEQLQHDPLSITGDDARKFHKNYTAVDPRSAHIVSAIESYAQANEEKKATQTMASPPLEHTSLHVLLKALHITIDNYPADVTGEDLKLAQNAVSRMQKAFANVNVPHPELEAELQNEFAKIVPKVEQGTVTKEEADHLHSLEARAHGHTEKGGITATAQSAVSKKAKCGSISAGSLPSEQPADREAELKEEAAKLAPKVKDGTVTKAEADHLHSLEFRAHGHTEKGGVAATAQSVAAKEATLKEESSKDESKVNEGTVTTDEANRLQSLEARTHGSVEKGGVAASAQSVAAKEAALKKESAKVDPEVQEGTVTQAEADHLHSLETGAHGHTEKGGAAASAQSVVAKEGQHDSVTDSTASSETTDAEASHPDTTEKEGSKEETPVQKGDSKDEVASPDDKVEKTNESK